MTLSFSKMHRRDKTMNDTPKLSTGILCLVLIHAALIILNTLAN